MAIWALHLDSISLPPGHASTELKSLQVWEDMMIEKSAKPCWIVTAYLETITYSVVNITFSFDTYHSCHYHIAQHWIFDHNILPLNPLSAFF
jgi:hypothetical protein